MDNARVEMGSSIQFSPQIPLFLCNHFLRMCIFPMVWEFSLISSKYILYMYTYFFYRPPSRNHNHDTVWLFFLRMCKYIHKYIWLFIMLWCSIKIRNRRSVWSFKQSFQLLIAVRAEAIQKKSVANGRTCRGKNNGETKRWY